MFGDADSIPPMHAAQFFELLGGGKRDAGRDGAGMSSARLAILSGTTHYTVLPPRRWHPPPLFLPQYGGGCVPDNDAQPLHEEQGQQQYYVIVQITPYR